MATHVEATVHAVTVFPDRARVTVRGRADLTAGPQRLIVGDLPLALDPDSVTARGAGTAAARLLGVEIQHAFFEQTPADQVRRLEEDIEQVEDELGAIADAVLTLEGQGRYLEGLRQATEQYARGLARGRTTVEDQARLADYIREQDLQLRAETRELNGRKRDLDRRLSKLRQELAQWQQARRPRRYQAAVDLDVAAAGSFELELTYVVGEAAWQPLYEWRLQRAESGDAVELTVLAQISQRTGQDWQAAQLVLSTARPALNQQQPELSPWYLDVYTPPPPQPMPRAAKGTMAAAGVAQPLKAPEAAMREFDVATAAAAVSEAVVTFELPGQTDIPGDGSPRKVTVTRFGLQPEIDYVAVPKLAAAAFRRVRVTHDGPGPLLPGRATLFAAGEFIGATHLAYTPAGDEIELLFGAEERLVVERELTRREVDKVLLRDRRQLRYGYEITVHNLLDVPARLELHDQFPVSRNEAIKVRLDRADPEPAERNDLNLLEWHLLVPPGDEQVVTLEFAVDHPRDLTVVGLID